jgi:hypothetical protein
LTHIRKYSPIQERDYDVVERATLDMAVNEYLVKHPYNLKGTSISLTHVAGLIPKEILRTVEEVQDKLLPGTDIKAHTSMLVMYCVMRDILPKVHSTCIIGITAEATEFGIVENDLLISNSFVPHGTQTVLRSYARKSNRPIADINTMITDVSETNVIPEIESDACADEYVTEIARHIESYTEHRTLPTQILIAVDTSYKVLFNNLIEKALIKAVGKGCIITCVDQNLVHNDMYKETVHDYDLFINIAGRFFHKLHGCAEMDTTK